MNTVGSYICGCRNGYRNFTKINWELFINEPYCVDIDECSYRHICSKKSTCKNTDGSYICQCDQGFGGDLCEDIDECSIKSTCDLNAACLNIEGSYVCSCNFGYRGNGITCKVGQCEDRLCPPDQKCISPTSNECQCREGLSMNTELDFCEDVDECLLDHGCGQNSTCVNKKGSFKCDCNSGYIGDGESCEAGSCTDDMCPINAECVMPSSFECRCKNGFELQLLKSNETDICVDTDECSTLRGICHEKAVCMNLPGGYECNCIEGYFGDGKTCFPGSCTEINCPPSDLKECLSPRTNDCKCIEGFSMSNSSICIDVDECKNEPCDQNANCANNHGNFSCTCSIGFFGDGVSCTEEKAVLVLNGNKALLVNAKDQSNVTMTFDSGTEVYQSCSVTFRNRFYVFGGHNRKRRISEVTQCELKRIGKLDFSHEFGACSNVNDREIYLCFDLNDDKQCRSGVGPLEKFTEIAPSTYRHQGSRTAASPSKFQVTYILHIIFSQITCSW